ncbi:SDR family NAD(P)-dependent oxidoreductase [Brevundimonas sp. VNH65]|uniref:SDR family NAD(P)-dependent oxidoreductase n=1 Tax=Brevundimonas sp. VNH65 TaxID=3400917 RepID=UPI000A3CFEB5|nr:SDR family oxidoreductase [Novosphingobium panipatense]
MTQHALIVTGGGRGIGAEIVRGAAMRGIAVAFSYQADDEAANRLVSGLKHEHRVIAVRCDVADPGAASRFMDEAEKQLGQVTMVVNNAGVTGPLGAFVDATSDTLKRTLDVNLLGTMWLAQEAARRWLARGTPGRMVNISSIAATLGAPGEYVHYAATKAGVEAFTVGLGKELAPKGIRINAVSPGTVLTEIHAAAGEPDRPARVAARIPVGRPGEASEIAAAVLWLLSDEASYVNATVLRVAGGL